MSPPLDRARPRDHWRLHCLPLATDASRLKWFVDRFLNVAPTKLVRFRLLDSSVHLLRFSSPTSTSDATELPDAIGFGVPVSAWQQQSSGLHHLGEGYCLPYLFVAAPHLLLSFRQRFGWGTAIGVLSMAVDEGSWLLKTQDYSRLELGRPPNDTAILQIFPEIGPERHGPSGPSIPSSTPPRATIHPRDTHGLHFFSLAQYRDAQHPNLACYQAITSVSLRWLRPLQPDPTPPRFDLFYRHVGWIPIAQNLGLRLRPTSPEDQQLVQSRGDRLGRARPSASVLQLDAAPLVGDVAFHESTTLARRFPDGWATKDSTEPSVQRFETCRRSGSRAPYNRTCGDVFAQVSELPLVEEFHWFVLPLKASPEALRSFCTQAPFFLEESPHRFTPIAGSDTIYLLVESYDRARMPNGAQARLPFRVVDLILVTDWTYHGHPMGAAFLVPFLFSDNLLAVALNRWIAGFPGQLADIRGPHEHSATRVLEVRLQEDDTTLLKATLDPSAHSVRRTRSPWSTGRPAAVNTPLGSLLTRTRSQSFILHKTTEDVHGRPDLPPYEALVHQHVSLRHPNFRNIEAALRLQVRGTSTWPLHRFLAESPDQRRRKDGVWDIALPPEQCFVFGASVHQEQGFNLMQRFGDVPWHPTNTEPSASWLRTLEVRTP